MKPTHGNMNKTKLYQRTKNTNVKYSFRPSREITLNMNETKRNLYTSNSCIRSAVYRVSLTFTE